MPSILAVVTMARAPVRLSATVNSACRQSSGKTATTRPARCAASTVNMSSTVFGSWTAMTELFGKPASMKWAASAEIARSACAKVRRFGGWPVMRFLLMGSIRANASGLRPNMRRNNTSSVGDTLVWITASLRLLLRPRPPGLREISRQRSSLWPFYTIPARDPLLLDAKHWNRIKAGHQDAVQCPHGRNRGGVLASLKHGRDQDVDRRIAHPHVVSRPLNSGGLAAPVKRLLIAWRKRLIPPVLDHVEIETELALIELNRVHRAYRGIDAGALEIADISQRNPLLV